MLSPLVTPSALSVDTNTLGTNALQQAKNATTVIEQDIIQHYVGTQGKQKHHFRTNGRSCYRNTNNCQHNSISPSRHRQSCHSSTSCTCRSPHPARKHRRSPTPRFHQVSHITSTVHSRPENKLATDVASDGHTTFHTTLQMLTKQGYKSIPVKVNPGMNVNTIPLSKYRKIFPAHFTKAGNLKQKALHTTRHTWTAHDDKPQQFLGFFIADIHHKTKPDVLPVRLYVFKNTTSPNILLSYATSERLGTVKFQITNEAPSTTLDTISLTKHVTFRTQLHTYRPVKPMNSRQQPLKPAIKFHTFQDHSAQSSKKQPFQDHVTTPDVCNIVAIKAAFPKSFDRVGNMPGTYTIRTDPSMPPVQHARCKVLIECK